MTFKQPRSVQVVVFSRRNRGLEYLLLKRVTEQGGFWQTVTGSLEASETHREAARREVMEETGIAINIDDLIELGITNVFEIAPKWRWKYAPQVTHNEEVCFAVEVDKLKVRIDPLEHQEYRWVDYQAAIGMLQWDSSKHALSSVHKMIE